MRGFRACFSLARNLKVINKLKQQPETPQFTMPYGDDGIGEIIFNTSAHTAQPTPEGEQPEKQSPKDQLKLIRETVLYEGDDPYAEKIVERPQKGRLWGFEGELVRQRDVYFNSADSVTLDRLVTFLELNQIKDIVEHDLTAYGRNLPQRYGIVGTMYSSQHGWKICKELIKSFMALYEQEMAEHERKSLKQGMRAMKEDPEDRGSINTKRIWQQGVGTFGKPAISGAKDDEWLMVYYKEFMVHLFTEDCRNEVDIEAKWMYQPTEEQQSELEKIQVATRSGKRGFFEPLK